MLSYFQGSPVREPMKIQVPENPDVFVVSVENDNKGRVVNRCREAGYSHPNAIKFPSRKQETCQGDAECPDQGGGCACTGSARR